MKFIPRRAALALACLGACLSHGAGAQAQSQTPTSSVQIYGTVDLGVGQIETQPPGAPNAPIVTVRGVHSGNLQTSYIGFRGSEDLGDGLTARFQLESFMRTDVGQNGRFDASPGGAADYFWSRETFVGLGSPKFGELRLGVNAHPTWIAMLQSNALGANSVFSPSFRQLFNGGTRGRVEIDTAMVNSVRYLTPNFAGLEGSVAVQAGEGSGTRYNFSANVGYRSGPLFVTAAVTDVKHAALPNLPGARDQQVALVGGSYDFGVVKLFGQYTAITNDRLGTKEKLPHIGLSAPIGLGQLQFSTGQDKSSGASTAKRTTTSLGYVYSLSKRTDVYAFAMADKVSVGTADSYVVGIRHRFEPNATYRAGNDMNTPDNIGGKTVLTLAHVAGMVDLVALPVWIGALMQHYRYSPPQAGITVTLFLLGVVLSSLFFAPRFNRLPRRAAVATGFALAAFAFFVASRLPVEPTSFGLLAGLHALAGAGVGCALSFTHGCIGRSANPHRLFGLVSVVLGVFAVLFLGGVPQLILHFGASVLFDVIAATMALAALVTAVGFPDVEVDATAARPGRNQPLGTMPLRDARLPRATWFVIAVVMCLTLNQAMVFSFVERIGAERGFGVDRVNGVLIALGLVNLLPGALAAWLQHRWSAVAVGMAGPIGQAVLALTMSSALTFAPYAVAAAFYVFMVIFTHTFLFGLLSRLDQSGRAVAATPAMMMVGSCIGPALGGALVQSLGYPGLGWAACVIATVAVLAMTQVRRYLPAAVMPADAGGRANAAHA